MRQPSTVTAPCWVRSGDARTHLGENEPRGGRLSPGGDTATDAPGWQITTRSRRLAVAVAATLSGGTVQSHKKGE